MNQEQRFNAMVDIVKQIHPHMQDGSAAKRNQFLGGLLANVVGPIPDEAWSEMMEDSKHPCGQPDCGCETLRTETFTTLDKLRTDWREQMR